jgi:hypothetical protein
MTFVPDQVELSFYTKLEMPVVSCANVDMYIVIK